jgi:hypothetical protein
MGEVFWASTYLLVEQSTLFREVIELAQADVQAPVREAVQEGFSLENLHRQECLCH